jgi:hypothetical protein
LPQNVAVKPGIVNLKLDVVPIAEVTADWLIVLEKGKATVVVLLISVMQ